MTGARAALRHDQAHPYEGADPGNAVRLVALLWLLSGVLALAFMPLEPPNVRVGAIGWVAASAAGVLSIVGAVRLLKQPERSFGSLLALSYFGLVQVALLVWLGGGAGSAYQMLFLLWVASGMGVHPPQRACVFLAATAVVASAPLLYDGWSGDAGADVATSLLLWAAIGTAMLTLMVTVRAQRVRLKTGELREHGLARADQLTGLGNRRAFDEALDHELARSARAESTVSIVLLDVDQLKLINDNFGHIEGDRCLSQVAGAISRAVRAGDRAFRWGGDEFAILLPDTDLVGAEKAAASICAEVMQTCADARGHQLSVSAGHAEARTGTERDELVGRADMELMARKREKLSLR